MYIQREDHVWSRFKDHLHFYVSLGVVPLAIITTYVNITVGQATLTEIPEGYTPHYYEYFKSPISRFLAKNLLYDKAIDHETIISRISEDSEYLLLKRLKMELKDSMKQTLDQKNQFHAELDIRNNMHFHNRYKDEFYLRKGSRNSGP